MPYVGGVAMYIKRLTEQLKLLGHEVDILVHKPGMRQYYMPTQGRVLHKEKVLKPIRTELALHYARQRLYVHPSAKKYELEKYAFEMAAAYFGLGQYDVIHAQDLITARALWRVKPSHIPLIATLHSYWAESIPYISAMKRYGAVSSNHTIVPSQWLKNQLVANHQVPPDHLTVIPHGIESKPFLLPTPLTRSSDKKVILCTARLAPEKGHEYLLESLAKLLRVRTDWTCWLVGDGPMRRKLESRCRNLGLQKHVRFLGTRHDVPQLLHRADIFALASLKEVFGFAIVEAQMAGRPVVVTNAGAIPELVQHGHTGLLSPVRQSEAMFQNLKLLLENESLRQSLAENGRKFAMERSSVESMASLVVDVYRRVTAK
jgi:glycosyltransferase involved in cell wall biosynthesis